MTISNPKKLLSTWTCTCGLAGLLLGGCLGSEPLADDDALPAPPPEEAAAAVSSLSLQIEQAQRQLDRGESPEQVKAALIKVLADETITVEQRRLATLALSSAHEAAGETEAAVALIERELASRADDRSYDSSSLKQRLRQLLAPEPSGRVKTLEVESPEPASTFARVLLDYFPEEADGTVRASMLMAGGDSTVSDKLGTFNLRGALRAQKDEQCPLCEHHISVSRSVHRSDWTLIAERQAELGDALLVFYFDLGKNRIPVRYERYLPMKVADIVAQLEQNKSFAVAQERPGAPPVLLLAAPRQALLATVEDYLAQLTELPTEPVYFEISPQLTAAEIQAGMRGQWSPKVRDCYDQLRQRSPQAEGKLVMRFRIDAEGAVQDLQIEPEGAALTDRAFLTCAKDGFAELHYPATGRDVTVSYPVVFSNP